MSSLLLLSFLESGLWPPQAFTGWDSFSPLNSRPFKWVSKTLSMSESTNWWLILGDSSHTEWVWVTLAGTFITGKQITALPAELIIANPQSRPKTLWHAAENHFVRLAVKQQGVGGPMRALCFQTPLIASAAPAAVRRKCTTAIDLSFVYRKQKTHCRFFRVDIFHRNAIKCTTFLNICHTFLNRLLLINSVNWLWILHWTKRIFTTVSSEIPLQLHPILPGSES